MSASSAAGRMRRLRDRRRRGLGVFKVEIDEDELLSALLVSGRLSEAEALRTRQVNAALADILREWASRWRA